MYQMDVKQLIDSMSICVNLVILLFTSTVNVESCCFHFYNLYEVFIFSYIENLINREYVK